MAAVESFSDFPFENIHLCKTIDLSTYILVRLFNLLLKYIYKGLEYSLLLL
jgi:hypothetical protein